jgi:SnoaL-like domain
MDRERADAWLEGDRQAWEQADTPAVRSCSPSMRPTAPIPCPPSHTGHDGVAAYWTQACASQEDVRVRFGDPIVDGDRVAAEWWTVMRAGGTPLTLVGCRS